MITLQLPRRAEADLLDIGRYTLRTWAGSKAARYLDKLESCCQRLAGNPGLGRASDDIRPDLQRMEHGRHVVFYRRIPGGIFISRILHQRMLPGRHTIEE